jgi:hypothetical protein
MLEYYWQAFGPLDTFIWVFGGILFLLHFGSLVLYVYRYWWRLHPIAIENFDTWRATLLSFTEVLPLLGLLGTVIALLNTFYGLTSYGLEGADVPDVGQMVMNLAPALTTTISGLIWAAVNIFLNATLYLLQWFQTKR